MIKEELIIEGERVDLISEGQINRNLVLNSLGDFKAKQSSYSQTITLPPTSTNIRIFKGLGISGNQSRLQYRKLSCDYLYDSIPVFSGGYAIVNKVTSNGYEISIYNGLIEFSELIKSKKLSDLSLSALTHSLSVDAYKSIVDLGYDSPYQYAIIIDNLDRTSTDIAFGGDGSTTGTTTPPTFNLSETYPLIKAEYILRRIFNDVGFSVEGDLFDDENLYSKFQKEYVTLSQAYVYDTPASGASSVSITGITGNDIQLNETRYYPFTVYEPIDGLNGSDIAEITTGNNGFTAHTNDLIGIALNAEIVFQHATYFKFNVYKNGVFETSFQYDNNNLTNITHYIYVSAISGDTFSFEIEGKSGKFIKQNRLTIQYNNLEITYFINNESITVYGDFLNLGDMKQSDFIKDITSRYGLLLNKRVNDDTIVLKNINNLLNDKTNALDYSEKLITIKEESYEHSYAQRNYCMYQKTKIPNDEPFVYYAPFLYDYSFDIDSPLAPLEDTLIESEFELFYDTLQLKVYLNSFLSLMVTQHPLISKNEGVYEITDKQKLKLVNLEYWPLNEEYILKFENVTGLTVDHRYNYVRQPISFDYIISNYYSDFLKVLESYKVITVDLNLNLKDLHDFDFYKLIYLKQTGKYYYINRIKYNVISPIAEAELVEIPSFSDVTITEEVPVPSITISATSYFYGGTTYAIDSSFTLENLEDSGNYLITAKKTDNSIGYVQNISSSPHQFLISQTYCGDFEVYVKDIDSNITSNKVTVNIPCV